MPTARRGKMHDVQSCHPGALGCAKAAPETILALPSPQKLVFLYTHNLTPQYKEARPPVAAAAAPNPDLDPVRATDASDRSTHRLAACRLNVTRATRGEGGRAGPHATAELHHCMHACVALPTTGSGRGEIASMYPAHGSRCASARPPHTPSPRDSDPQRTAALLTPSLASTPKKVSTHNYPPKSQQPSPAGGCSSGLLADILVPHAHGSFCAASGLLQCRQRLPDGAASPEGVVLEGGAARLGRGRMEG